MAADVYVALAPAHLTAHGPSPVPKGKRQSIDSRRIDPGMARRALRRLYLLRVAFSATWVTLIFCLNSSTVRQASNGALVGVAIALYPTLNGLAALVDLNLTKGSISRSLLWCDFAAGLAAAFVIVSRSAHLGTEIRVFGLWAIVSGGAQLAVGAVRQLSLKGQWLMIISGAGSVVAGTNFFRLPETSHGLASLAQYSVGGAIWYLLTVGWVLASPRIAHQAAPSDITDHLSTKRSINKPPSHGSSQRQRAGE